MSRGKNSLKLQYLLQNKVPQVSSCHAYSNSSRLLGQAKATLPGMHSNSSSIERSNIKMQKMSLPSNEKGAFISAHEDVIAANKEAHTAAMMKYRTDTQTLSNWLDVSVVKIKGRLYPADNWLIPIENSLCIPFPVETQLTTLSGEEKSVDDIASSSAVRLVTFSFKQYGHTLAETWAKAVLESNLAKSIPVVSMCFVEYGFLSLAKGAFIKGLKGQVDPTRWERTGYVFGGVLDFATELLLPNKFTGYAYLIDSEGRVRWRGIGHAQEEDLQALQRCATALLEEEEHMRKS
jgi:hypothetical protein